MKVYQANLIGEVIGPEQIKDEIDSRVIMAADEIDWTLGNSFIHPTITGITTITDANLPQGTKTKCISLEIDGEYLLTFPAYWVHKDGTYNGAVMNRVIIDCINGNPGSEEVYYQIIPNSL